MSTPKATKRCAIVYCVNATYLSAAGISAISMWDHLEDKDTVDLIV